MKTSVIFWSLMMGCVAVVGTADEKSVQEKRLQQYAGTWLSAERPEADTLAEVPAIKMINQSKQQDRSLQVEVLQNRDGIYVPILLEQISYDTKTDQIVALGQNEAGECFIGKGRFATDRLWTMHDVDFNGDKVMRVEFEFLSPTVVLLEGFDPSGKSLWKTRYVKE